MQEVRQGPVAYAAKSVESVTSFQAANSLGSKASFSDWSPAYPGFYLYYPGRRQLPASLRAFVDFAKTAASTAGL